METISSPFINVELGLSSTEDTVNRDESLVINSSFISHCTSFKLLNKVETFEGNNEDTNEVNSMSPIGELSYS